MITGINWRNNQPDDPEFMAALARAEKAGVERCEAELFRRGFEGYEKPVYSNGHLVGTIREFDTTAAIFMLKGAKPDKYRDSWEKGGNTNVQVNVTAGPSNLSQLSTSELEAKLERARAALLPAPPDGSPAVIDVTPTQDGAGVETRDEAERRYAEELKRREASGPPLRKGK